MQTPAYVLVAPWNCLSRRRATRHVTGFRASRTTGWSWKDRRRVLAPDSALKEALLEVADCGPGPRFVGTVARELFLVLLGPSEDQSWDLPFTDTAVEVEPVTKDAVARMEHQGLTEDPTASGECSLKKIQSHFCTCSTVASGEDGSQSGGRMYD